MSGAVQHITTMLFCGPVAFATLPVLRLTLTISVYPWIVNVSAASSAAVPKEPLPFSLLLTSAALAGMGQGLLLLIMELLTGREIRIAVQFVLTLLAGVVVFGITDYRALQHGILPAPLWQQYLLIAGNGVILGLLFSRKPPHPTQVQQSKTDEPQSAPTA